MALVAFFGFCHCSDGRICPFCLVLTIICLAGIAGLMGYWIKKKK